MSSATVVWVNSLRQISLCIWTALLHSRLWKAGKNTIFTIGNSQCDQQSSGKFKVESNRPGGDSDSLVLLNILVGFGLYIQWWLCMDLVRKQAILARCLEVYLMMDCLMTQFSVQILIIKLHMTVFLEILWYSFPSGFWDC